MSRELPRGQTLHVGELLAEDVYVSSVGKRHLYDLHASPRGGWADDDHVDSQIRRGGHRRQRPGIAWLGKDAYLLPCSGFTFRSKDYLALSDGAPDDHTYYQGPSLRGGRPRGPWAGLSLAYGSHRGADPRCLAAA